MFAPIDSNDTAPGLETPDGYPSAVVLHDDARTVGPWLAARCYSSGLGLAFRWFDTEAEAIACAARLQADRDTDPPSPRDDDDCDARLVVARPSPGDDITRAAFDAMDGAS